MTPPCCQHRPARLPLCSSRGTGMLLTRGCSPGGPLSAVWCVHVHMQGLHECSLLARMTGACCACTAGATTAPRSTPSPGTTRRVSRCQTTCSRSSPLRGTSGAARMLQQRTAQTRRHNASYLLRCCATTHCCAMDFDQRHCCFERALQHPIERACGRHDDEPAGSGSCQCCERRACAREAAHRAG